MKTTRLGFWDNLITPKGGLSRPQLAGWTPGAPARSGLGCRVLANEMIEVAPSVSLAADVYLPKAAGRYPAVIAFAAYSKELQSTGAPAGNNETGSPPIFTDRGYAHVIATRRGMGRSGGADAVFLNETDAADHASIIRWASEQPSHEGIGRQVLIFDLICLSGSRK
jgi:predicted acyl esterase